MWRLISAFLHGFIFFHGFCLSETPPNYTFMYEATKAPMISFYDYIVIGGGTAGIPLATTLSEKYSVLLLERGGSPYGNPNITNVANYGSYFNDSSPNSPSQRFVSEDGIVNALPRVLGGGTSINAGFYSRGQAQFIKEARLLDDTLINESYQWVEKVMVFKPAVIKWQSALRDALVGAGVAPDNGFTYEHVTGTKVGGTIFDENGLRHTAADLLQYANPLELSLFLHATVHKILFKTNGTRPMAYGVEFKDTLGKTHRAYLKGGQKDEIIVSAGALGSPQLLMLSGLGPKEQLDFHKIKVVVNNAFIGQGMADNPVNTIFVPSPIPVERSVIQVVGITKFGSYIEATSGFNLRGRSLPADTSFSYEMGGFVFEKINGPVSTGDLKLRSSDPIDIPLVTFNYFKELIDLQKCVSGVRTILTAIQSKAFSQYKYPNMTIQEIVDLTVNVTANLPIPTNSTSSLEQFCKDTVRTIWHYHGGCQIGKVVDNDYKVLGVDGLRVIDGSTLLNSPGTNPQASVLMLGRYMGVTLQAKRLASEKSE